MMPGMVPVITGGKQPVGVEFISLTGNPDDLTTYNFGAYNIGALPEHPSRRIWWIGVSNATSGSNVTVSSLTIAGQAADYEQFALQAQYSFTVGRVNYPTGSSFSLSVTYNRQQNLQWGALFCTYYGKPGFTSLRATSSATSVTSSSIDAVKGSAILTLAGVANTNSLSWSPSQTFSNNGSNVGNSRHAAAFNVFTDPAGSYQITSSGSGSNVRIIFPVYIEP